MINSTIGLIDLDLLYTKTLSQPNYELCSVATYYKIQGINTRLIIDFSPKNLQRYSKILVFKSHRYSALPSQLIKDYYKLSVEEYGEGFINRPLHPPIPELVYITPDASIYLPLVNYLSQVKKSPYKLKHKPWFTKYLLIKFFYNDEGDILKRQVMPNKAKRLLIYDSPEMFFENEDRNNLLQEILNRNPQFATPIDISKVSNVESLELIMTHPKLATMRKTIFASSNNKNLKSFLLWCEKNKNDIKPARLSVELSEHDDYKYYLLNGLRIMNMLPERIGNKIKVYPRMSYEIRQKHYLLKYFYAWERAKFGSFYEYVVWKSYYKELTRLKLVGKIDTYTIDYLYKHYGMRSAMVKLEELMYKNKEAEDLIMKGGKSYYGRERIKYSYIGGTPRATKEDNYILKSDRIITRRSDITYRRNRNPNQRKRAK